MSGPSEASKETTPKLVQSDVPGFTWEIDENGCVVIPPDFLTNLKGKRTRSLPTAWFKKKPSNNPLVLQF